MLLILVYSPSLPLLVPRITSQAVDLGNGQVLPKGTVVMPNIYALHHNPAYWPDPDSFKPERFLDPANQRSQAWLPFGGGARACKCP